MINLTSEVHDRISQSEHLKFSLMEVNLNIILLATDARSYYDAYNVLNEKTAELRQASNTRENHQNDLANGDNFIPLIPNHTDISSPALVCLAFSVELHLKLLLYSHDIKAKGHDVGKLIKKLPQDDIDFISNHDDFHPTQQGDYFFKNIVTASDLFIKTRYYFENLGTLHSNTGFCATLTKVIRKRIVQRVPYLAYDLGTLSD